MLDYVVGAMVALLAVSAAVPITLYHVRVYRKTKIYYRQSYNYSQIQPWASLNIPKKELNTQSARYADRNSTRVVLTSDKAYWITSQGLMVADIVKGQVDSSTTRGVDTMGADDVELSNLVFIVEKLTEGITHEGDDSRDK